MKKLIFLFALIPCFAKSQVYVKPNNSFGNVANRNQQDSTLHYPTGCGIPTDTTFLREHGGKNNPKMSAIYYDSCGHHEYIWDPSAKAWHVADSSAGSTNTTLGGRIPLAITGTNSVKSLDTAWGMKPLDTATAPNVVKFGPDSNQVSSKAYTNHIRDSVGIASLDSSANRMIHLTIANIRTYVILFPGQQFYYDNGNISGIVYYDSSDHSSADDSAMVWVNSNNQRLKRFVTTPYLNAEWFGAVHDNITDDQPHVQKGVNYINAHPSTPRTLFLPQGNYRMVEPLIIANFNGTTYGQVTVNLMGVAAAKNDPLSVTTNLNFVFENTFGIGIQQGKGCRISNLTVNGNFSFPLTLGIISVDTMTAAQWTDGVARQDKYSPYTGIVVDPFSDSTAYPLNSDMYPGLHAYCPAGMGTSGSTDITISNCNVNQFVVGILLTAAFQQNGDIVNVSDINFGGNKYSYAITQAQSKDCHVDRFQAWSPVHTIFDCGTFGANIGGGISPIVNGGNIAGAVKQLCNMTLGSFSGSMSNVYGESIFKIGYVFAPAGFSFNNCIVDFSASTSNYPFPDFFYLGTGVTFNDCMMRLYSQSTERIVMAGSNVNMRGGSTNAPPLMVNLDVSPAYAVPTFKNVSMYYSGGVLGSTVATNNTTNLLSVGLGSSIYPKPDPVYSGSSYEWVYNSSNASNETIKVKYEGNYDRIVDLGNETIFTNKTNWTGYFVAPAGDTVAMSVGDILATSDIAYQDQFTGTTAPTYPIGFITNISNDTVYFTSLAVGIQNNTSYHVFECYYVNSNIPITGNMAAGASIITSAQCAAGVLPAAGTRIDIPQAVAGTKVRSVGHDTIYLSFQNLTGQSFTDYTWTNGFPKIDIYSDKTPSQLIFNGAQARYLIGGARYHLQNSGGNQLTQMGNTTFDEYLIGTTIYNGDTSKHKLKYYNIFSNTAGNSVPIGTTAQAQNVNYMTNGTSLRIFSDSVINGVKRLGVNDGSGWRVLSIYDDINGLTLQQIFTNQSNNAILTHADTISNNGNLLVFKTGSPGLAKITGIGKDTTNSFGAFMHMKDSSISSVSWANLALELYPSIPVKNIYHRRGLMSINDSTAVWGMAAGSRLDSSVYINQGNTGATINSKITFDSVGRGLIINGLQGSTGNIVMHANDSALYQVAAAGGMYLPTDISGSRVNVASITIDSAIYRQVDNTVWVDGEISVTPTAGSSTGTQIVLVIPINSAFPGGHNCWGQTSLAGGQSGNGTVQGNTPNSNQILVSFTATTTSAVSVFYHYSYRID